MNCMNLVKLLTTRVLPKFNTFINTSFSDKYLLYTNVGLSVSLSAVGDIIQQQYEILVHDSDKWNPIRTRNMSICGMTIGVFCHYWYNFLDRRLPGYTIRTVVKKVVIDQFVCSPICITMFFATCGVLERKTSSEILDETKRKGWLLYAADWAVWPPAQFISFYFLSTRYRVLYDNLISLGYDVYTSYVKHKYGENEES